MTEIFIRIVNVSLTATYCIVAVLPIRFLLRKQPKIYSYLLWSVVLFRLLCPFSLAGADSLLPTGTELLSRGHLIERQEPEPAVWQGKGYLNEEALLEERNGAIPTSLMASAGVDMTAKNRPEQRQWIFVAGGFLWLAGVAVLLCCSVLAVWRLQRFLKKAAEDVSSISEERVWEIEGITTPFVFGIRKPCIYLPTGLSAKERSYALAHERIHVERRDYLVKGIAWCAVCLHWFNPFVWLAYVLMERDMEMSCDEAVLQQFGSGARREYSLTLLSLSCEKNRYIGGSTAFGAGQVKKRVQNILSYRGKSFMKGILFLGILGGVAFGLFLIPTGEERQEPAEVSEDMGKFVSEYADAYCVRNGDLMVSFFIDEETAISDVIEMEKGGGSYTFGYSSPWPDEFRFVVRVSQDEAGGEAQIWNYAWTSDPHVSVWKEEMTFVMTPEGYRVTESSMEFLDDIASGDAFDEAYRIAGEYCFTDYEERGFVEAINSQTAYDAEEGAEDRNAVYRNPANAAAWIFNLTGGSGEMVEQHGKHAVVRYTFADGSDVMIPMKNANAGAEAQSFPESEPIWILDLEKWRVEN
ncbi:MAG: M56 family metallopeptidase [Lachnospiraceae bacterium]|nr:M56 family metallopeptidase [Lachnospiraceae bacterium]